MQISDLRQKLVEVEQNGILMIELEKQKFQQSNYKQNYERIKYQYKEMVMRYQKKDSDYQQVLAENQMLKQYISSNFITNNSDSTHCSTPYLSSNQTYSLNCSSQNSNHNSHLASAAKQLDADMSKIDKNIIPTFIKALNLPHCLKI